MKKLIKGLLVLVSILSLSMGLFACSTKNYTITVTDVGGNPMSGITVSVGENGSIFTGTTNDEGKVTFKAKKGEYDVVLSNLPDGFMPAQLYKTSKKDKNLNVVITSGIIEAEIPRDKVYQVGDVFYDFSIKDCYGQTLTLSDLLRDKRMVLINFWSTGCGPCVSEMPALQKVYEQFSSVADVLAISVPIMADDSDASVREFRETNRLSFHMAKDHQGYFYPNHMTIAGIPVTIVIDRYGVMACYESGSCDEERFTTLFSLYSSDDYVPDYTKPPIAEVVEMSPPPEDLKQTPSSAIEQAINGTDLRASWYPETESEDAALSWPWVLEESNGEKYITPSNSKTNYTFATIKTKFSVSQADVRDNGKVVLAFDFKVSSEEYNDNFYVIVNSTVVYTYSGTTEYWPETGWKTSYALVADEPGTYELVLMYYKDQQQSLGEDTVRVKNVRLITTNEIMEESLDMPRFIARNWDGNSFTYWLESDDIVADEQGFYHKDSSDGPFILADLINSNTPFTSRMGNAYSVGEYAVGGEFDFNTANVGDPDYDESLDMTDEITVWLTAANNSEIDGLTTVNKDLVDLLNRFLQKKLGAAFDENKSWLEFCLWFDHYGTDLNDPGISTADRNPINGVTNFTAFEMKPYSPKPFDNLNDIPAEYKTEVNYNRSIYPRGLRFVFKPDKDGVYRFRTQSVTDKDTIIWLFDYDDVSLSPRTIISSDNERELPDKNCNTVVTIYLEAGTQYIIRTGYFFDGIYGKYTLTAEYLGDSCYVWNQCSSEFITTDEFDLGQLRSIFYVLPVLSGNQWYDAKQDKYGNYIDQDGKTKLNEYGYKLDENGYPLRDPQGNYIPGTPVADLSDPLYLNINGGTSFSKMSIASAMDVGSESKILDNIVKWVPFALNVSSSKKYGRDTLLTTIKGEGTPKELTTEDYTAIKDKIVSEYGDTLEMDADMFEQFCKVKTLGDIVDFLRKYIMSPFDFRNVAYLTKYYDKTTLRDYSAQMQQYLDAANENLGNPELGYADAGCVKLTDELKKIIELYARRYGYPELETDWIRLCCHYENLGPTDNAIQ